MSPKKERGGLFFAYFVFLWDLTYDDEDVKTKRVSWHLCFTGHQNWFGAVRELEMKEIFS